MRTAAPSDIADAIQVGKALRSLILHELRNYGSEQLSDIDTSGMSGDALTIAVAFNSLLSILRNANMLKGEDE